MLYQVRNDTASGEKADISVEANLMLSGTLGLPLDHPVSPRSLFIKIAPGQTAQNLNSSPYSLNSSGFWVFKEAIETAYHADDPVSLTNVCINLPEQARLRKFGRSLSIPLVWFPTSPSFLLGSFGDTPCQAVVIKISNIDEPGGKIFFLVLGLNTRRPLDASYRSRIDDLRNQLLSCLAITTSFESQRSKALQLQSIEKAKSFFFSSVSHELRTPLQVRLCLLCRHRSSCTHLLSPSFLVAHLWTYCRSGSFRNGHATKVKFQDDPTERYSAGEAC